MDITPKSAQKLKPVLERWLAEAELWNLMVKEMRAGRSMADLHKVRGLLVGGGGNDGTEGIASILVVSVGSRTHTGITEEGVV